MVIRWSGDVDGNNFKLADKCDMHCICAIVPEYMFVNTNNINGAKIP